MTTIKLSDEKAREIYPGAAKEIKSILEESFPKGFFNMNIEERASTFELAHAIFQGMKLTDPDYLILQRRKVEDMTTQDKLMICAEVWRDGWKADYDDEDQEKWYAWVEKTASGWVFCDTYFEYTDTCTAVGPRFVQQTEKRAENFVKTFFPLIIDHLTIK